MITSSIEIARSPEDVFAYVEQLERHGEWQSTFVRGRREPEGPIHAGMRFTELRRAPGGEQELISEITEYDPPRRIAFRGVEGPFRVQGTIVIESCAAGSRYTLEFDMTGHGWGKFLAGTILGMAGKQIPIDQQKLKERLESGLDKR